RLWEKTIMKSSIDEVETIDLGEPEPRLGALPVAVLSDPLVTWTPMNRCARAGYEIPVELKLSVSESDAQQLDDEVAKRGNALLSAVRAAVERTAECAAYHEAARTVADLEAERQRLDSVVADVEAELKNSRAVEDIGELCERQAQAQRQRDAVDNVLK